MLAPLLAERARLFARKQRQETPPGFDVRVAALHRAGFGEVGTGWQVLSNRVFMAVRSDRKPASGSATESHRPRLVNAGATDIDWVRNGASMDDQILADPASRFDAGPSTPRGWAAGRYGVVEW